MPPTSRFAGQGLLQLLSNSLTQADSIPARELWQESYPAPKQWLIDPVEVAASNPDPRYLQAVQSVLQRAEAAGDKPVDLGALAMDAALQRVLPGGLRTNISSARSGPPVISVPIDDGVVYRREKRNSTSEGAPGTISEYVKFADTPMMDWDVPDPSHVSSSVSVRHLGDVEELARQYVAEQPESLLRVYQTPGGYRAWDLGVRGTPAQMAGQLERAKVDPNYVLLAQRGTEAVEAGIPVGQPGYSSRINAKPGRTDWVAQPILTLEGAAALPEPVSMRRVNTYHDAPIAQHFLRNGVSPEAIAMLQQQLPTASQSLRRELGAMFGI